MFQQGTRTCHVALPALERSEAAGQPGVQDVVPWARPEREGFVGVRTSLGEVGLEAHDGAQLEQPPGGADRIPAAPPNCHALASERHRLVCPPDWARMVA